MELGNFFMFFLKIYQQLNKLRLFGKIQSCSEMLKSNKSSCID